MKKEILITMLCVLGFCLSSKAQEVLAKSLNQVSGFISIDQMMSTYDNDFAYDQGVSAGILFNQSFYFGGFATTTLTHKNDGLNNFDDYDCFEPNFGSAGLTLGYILAPEKLVHFNFNTKVGVGAFATETKIENDFDFGSHKYYESVFMIQPNAGLEINVAKFFKINANVGYRYVSGIDDPSVNKEILNGMTGQVGLVIGWFGQKKSKHKIEPESEMMNL